MDNPRGTVRSFIADTHGRQALVEVDVTEACPRCAAGKGCGAGLLTGAGGTRQIAAFIPDSLELAAGDSVEVALKPRDLLHAALVVYGAPLLGALVAAGISYSISSEDVDGAAAALIGLAIGLLVSRWYLSQPACLNRFVPTIEKRLGANTAGA